MPVKIAFLSHAHGNKDFVHKVKSDLDKAGILTWLDEFQIGIGESIRQRIDQGISSSNFLLIFMSKAAVQSEWVGREIDAAFMREIESKDTVVIPLLIEDCEISATLKSKRYIDFRNDYNNAINTLIDTLNYPRRQVLEALTDRWVGESGALYLSTVGNLVIGKYDWYHFDKERPGNIFGNVERNRIKFNWTWDYTTERGLGIFDLDSTFQLLNGGWWAADRNIDSDLPLEELNSIEGFNKWTFEKDRKFQRLNDLREEMVNTGENLERVKNSLNRGYRVSLSEASRRLIILGRAYNIKKSSIESKGKILSKSKNRVTKKNHKKNKKNDSHKI